MDFVMKKVRVKCRTCKKERIFNMKVAEDGKVLSSSRTTPIKRARLEWRCECGLIQETEYRY